MPKRKSCAYGHATKMRHKRRKMTRNVQTRSSYVSDKAPNPVNIKQPSNSNRFTTKCRPNGLVNVINNLNPNQKQAVQDIGFGGLLEVKVSYIPQDILPWILSAFNWVSYKFKAAPSKEFSLSELDVHDFFRLPRGDRKIEVIPAGRYKLSAHELKSVWRKKFGISGTQSIPLPKLASMLVNCNESGDEFKRLFVLYSMSTFLAPPTCYSVDLKLLRAVEDVDEIKQLDWCSYVFQELLKGVKAYQDGKPYVCGCVLFLMLAYFHRIEFCGETQQCTLPLIQHWTEDKLLRRVKRELQSGSLGNGDLTRVSYPISALSSPSEGDDCRPQARSTKRFVEIELPVGVDTDEEIHAKSFNDVDEVVLLLKRDSDIVYQRYLDRATQIKSKTSNLALCERVDDLISKAREAKTAADNLASLELFAHMLAKGNSQEKGPKGGGKSNDQNISNLNETSLKVDVGINEQSVGCSMDSNVDNSSFQLSKPPEFSISSKRKLLVLDVYGLLADIVVDKRSFPDTFKPDFTLEGKKVFKRPFCDEFLQFCFEKFDVGIWSSEAKNTLTSVVDFLMKNTKNKLLFCWDQSHCTDTGLTTVENTGKPLFLKELKRVWENEENDLPWKKGFYDKSNTILLDNSPYKAMRNPPYTTVFPSTYSFKVDDESLGPNGDLRLYLERLSEAKNVQMFIKANPFGQRPIQKLTRSVTKRMRNR